MEVKINVEESRFKDVLENELEAFSREELHSIIENAMKEYLMNDEMLQKIFLGKQENWNGTYSFYPSELMKKTIEKIDISPVFKELQNKIISYFTQEENVKNAARDIFAQLIQRGVSRWMMEDENFLRDVTIHVNNAISGSNR